MKVSVLSSSVPDRATMNLVLGIRNAELTVRKIGAILALDWVSSGSLSGDRVNLTVRLDLLPPELETKQEIADFIGTTIRSH